MEKNTELIAGTILLVGGLYAASKTTNKEKTGIKDDIGIKTLSYIVSGIGAYIIYKSTKSNK